jgi:hypothetical protein
VDNFLVNAMGADTCSTFLFLNSTIISSIIFVMVLMRVIIVFDLHVDVIRSNFGTMFPL